jgi:hypothetical protein
MEVLMSRLTYEDLILLDNLIYLKWDAKENELLINIVYNLLSDEDFYKKMENTLECLVKTDKNEWINILKQIMNKPNLCKLKVKNIDNYKSGIKSACFIDDEGNATVVFRGTTTIGEWEDNEIGVYDIETIEQLDALNFINNLDYNNITVTGHSKGGNKAQYVTILSPKIDRCVSVNGQGFSNEFISKYKVEVDKNKFKITSINAKYDYVNCLLNSISEKNYYIKTEVQINPVHYHKANILLDDNGNLREETNEAMFSKAINLFSQFIISNLPKEIISFVVDKIIDIIEFSLCKKECNNNLLKMPGEFLIMYCYENNFMDENIFDINKLVLEILFLPILFWDDFINIEENNSEDLIKYVSESIYALGNGIINKLKIIDKNQIELINQIAISINYFTSELLLVK